MNIEITPTTLDDLKSFYPQARPWRIRALTVRAEGEIIGIGGYVIRPDGGKIAFVEASEENCKRYPFALARATRRFLAETRDDGVKRMVAYCDGRREAAARWLVHLGFENSGTLQGESVYLWRD